MSEIVFGIHAVQALLEPRSAKPVAGWKIAATSSAGQKHINVGGPLAGRILAERVHPDGAALPMTGNRMAVAEAEFVFVMARDLVPRATPFTQAEVMDAVAALHLGRVKVRHMAVKRGAALLHPLQGAGVAADEPGGHAAWAWRARVVWGGWLMP